MRIAPSDTAHQKRTVDFDSIWRRQSQGDAMDETVATVAEQVHEILIHPHPGISNVTEWAKKEACWDRVRDLVIDWPDAFLGTLVSTEERRDAARTARREQRKLNGIEAQIAVVNAGAQFWLDALEWGKAKRLLTPTEIGILDAATRVPARMPSDKQSSRVIEILAKLRSEGYPRELGSSP